MAQASPIVTLVKAQARVSEGYDDDLLGFYVSAAITQCERLTGVPLRRATRRRTITLDAHGRFDLGEAPRGRVTAAWVGSDWHHVAPRPVNAVVAGSMLSVHGLSSGALIEVAYEVGPADHGELLTAEPDLALGIVRFATHAYEHRGDSDMSSWAEHSGALDLWRSRQKVIAA